MIFFNLVDLLEMSYDECSISGFPGDSHVFFEMFGGFKSFLEEEIWTMGTTNNSMFFGKQRDLRLVDENEIWWNKSIHGISH